ncbi:MAG: M24 family metallopeptidase [Candidatus Aenigmarchaeota archaeon]|nr:M24 family metallopeptidase [Candidatus Aenigmarchaeota archaeon]
MNKITKSKEEIELIKKSAEIANSCLPLLENMLKKKDVREIDIAVQLKRKIRSMGGKIAFDPLVACGKRASNIHAKPTKKLIQGLGYVDFGVSFKGYKVDLTVPFIKGEVGEKEKNMFEALLKAYKIALKSIKIGVKCFSVFEKVDTYLRKNNFKMMHSLGHGIGKKVHELPTIGVPKFKLKKIGKKKKEKLEIVRELKFERNMIFTIEPGIYVKGVGGCRIENTFLLTDKLKALTKAKPILC